MSFPECGMQWGYPNRLANELLLCIGAHNNNKVSVEWLLQHVR